METIKLVGIIIAALFLALLSAWLQRRFAPHTLLKGSMDYEKMKEIFPGCGLKPEKKRRKE